MSVSKTVQWPREFDVRKVRRDAVAVIVMCVIATASVITLAILKFRELFVPGGISWSFPVTPQRVVAESANLYGRENRPIAPKTVTGMATHVQVIVTDATATTAGFLAASIIVATLTGLVIVVCTGHLARTFLSGRFFTLQTSRILRVLMWTAAIGGPIAFLTWTSGSNGVEVAALGATTLDSGQMQRQSWYWIAAFVLTSFGLVDIALRRAIRLQHETEGLV